MQFNSSQAIYKQIIDDYKKQIIRGELKIGDKIPSQREYAEKARVNPNTVQRAYREMENMNMVETLRGQGTFVTASEKMKTEIQTEMASKLLDFFISEMHSLGYHDEKIIDMIMNKKRELGEVDNND